MLFIGGISTGIKPIEYLKTVICSHCGAYGRYQVYMTFCYFSFFFIPLFKWNKRFYVQMSCCGAVYELDSEVGRMLLRGAETEIREEDLTLCRDGGGNPWSREAQRNGYGNKNQCGIEEPETGSLTSGSRKQCPQCGYETGEDFAYCPKCGSMLEKEER